MRENAADLGVEHADELRPARRRNAEQLLNREAKPVFLAHRRDVIEPDEIRNSLQIRLRFDQLFGAAVEQPDVRIDPLDDLTIELEDETQHAVRRRMLRAEVDSEIAQARLVVHGFCSAFSSPGSL